MRGLYGPVVRHTNATGLCAKNLALTLILALTLTLLTLLTLTLKPGKVRDEEGVYVVFTVLSDL